MVVVSKRCRLHVLSRKSTWESLVRQSQLLANTSIGSCSQLLPSIFLKKQDWTLRAGFEPAREIPLGFQVQRVNHSAITALLTLFIFWWNLIPSLDYFLLALLFAFLLRIVVMVVSKWCRLHVRSRKSNWESLVRQSQLFANTSIGSWFPTFSDCISEKWDRRLWGGLDRARGVPIGFQVQHFNHWAITALLTLILFWWNPIPSSDKFLLALIFDFLLRVVVVVVSKRCRRHVLSRKSNWESLVRQSRLLASTSIGSCSQLLPNILLKKIERCEQGSNLRGKFPLDFKSNALTTRPSQLFWHYSFFWWNLIPSVD